MLAGASIPESLVLIKKQISDLCEVLEETYRQVLCYAV